MNVHVYVDGFNLYYGGRKLAPARTRWKWLDLRGLVTDVAQRHWPSCTIKKVVHCTARVSALTNPAGQRDQDIYLKALIRSKSVDWIEYGRFYEKAKVRPLARQRPGGQPVIVYSDEPVLIQATTGVNIRNARFMVTVADREEKGTGVNIASHLLTDALTKKMDAAIVVSNDSDLAYPVSEARKLLPVGLVNPRGTATAGALAKLPKPVAGKQWKDALTVADLMKHQLPDPCMGYSKPSTW